MAVALLLAVIYLGVQLISIAYFAHSPFTDEAIYITAGRRILEGYAANPENLDFYYWKWFQGSPWMWPPLVAIAYDIGGIAGARLLSAILSSISLFTFYAAWRQLFSKEVAVTSLYLSISFGLLLFLGHFAVYDVLALCFFSVAVFLVSLYCSTRPRCYLLIGAAFMLSLSAYTKYFYAAGVLPCVILFFGVLPLREATRAAGLFVAVFALAFGLYWYSVFGSDPLQIFAFYTSGNASSRVRLLLQFANWLLLVVPLALCGAAVAKRNGVAWAVPFCLSLLAFVLSLHLSTATHVSAQKHTAFAFLLAAPLCAFAMQQIRKSGFRLLYASLLLALPTLGFMNWYTQVSVWPDSHATAAFLRSRIEQGQRLAAIDGWPYRLALYWDKRIESPYDVLDEWNIRHGKSDLCELSWLIGTETSNAQDIVFIQAKHCGFKEAFSSITTAIREVQGGNYRMLQLRQVVFQNPKILAKQRAQRTPVEGR